MTKALKLHRELRGKIEIKPKIKVSKENFPLVYTPGIAEPAKEISKDPEKVFEYTGRGNNVAIITDGSRTIGVGDSIPEASLPIMEGKALLLKFLAGVDAYPLCLKTKKVKEIIKTIEILSPNFAAFNIEDIQSPKCFAIMKELGKRNLIVFHDDQQGTAIAVLAALFNALKVVGKKLEKVRICLAGAGAGGYGIFKILNHIGVKNIIVFDKDGIIFRGRKGNNKYQKEIAKFTNLSPHLLGGNPDDRTAGIKGWGDKENLKGGLKEAIEGSDVFIGVTGKAGLLNSSNIKQMQEKPIIFAISNPEPEIIPEEIEKATKNYVYATGRSDYQNQINNVLVFPGVFKGLLKTRKKMDLELEFKIAKAIASLIKNPQPSYIIPNIFDKRLVKTIVACIKEK